MLALLTGLLIARGVIATPGPYELHERLTELDVAWSKSDPGVRPSSLRLIKEADQAADKDEFSKACSALDRAICILEARPHESADAVSLRPASLHIEPGASMEIRVRWAYEPSDAKPVKIRVSNKNFIVKPMEERSFSVDPYLVNPDLRQTPEAGYLLPVQVGTRERHVFVSIAKRVPERVTLLGASKSPVVKDIAHLLGKIIENPENDYGDMPLIEYLFQAEQFSDGRTTIQDCEDLYFAHQGTTDFRASFPKGVGAPKGVVIALPSRNRDLNSYFDRQGRGEAVKEALNRGWVFVSAVGGDSRIDDVLMWLQANRAMSAPLTLVLQEGDSDVDVSSASAVAYLGTPRRATAKSYRIFESSHGSGQVLDDGRIERIGACEDLVLAAEAVPKAFEFFDQSAKLLGT